ncbi:MULTISPECIES: antitoxin Xre-like helix-turn-helix domain-containing protein [Acinetobacter]|uniref:antitoxin Xre-like helix-turn-helix domain-containing protein n=1 Tax=Acinetobacter TaxID=469 RepID=UPI0015D40092|nr:MULTISPECIES: antitoxin Xre-like helix-turn-helix domain-containing protein [Acinetobacter]QTD65691.1 hypothetical protein J4G46_13920 [Acinetobacter towneri]
MNTPSSRQSLDQKRILAKAFFKASEQLNLSQTQLAMILGISELEIHKLRSEGQLDPFSQQGERALLIIRLFKALYNLSGGDQETIQLFLSSRNQVTGGIPLEQIETMNGLVACLQFVELIQR